ncbi:hypothetical protein LguiA_019577 [Lonicera macranthoides]
MENDFNHTTTDFPTPPSDNNHSAGKSRSPPPPSTSPLHSPPESTFSSNQSSLSHGFSPREEDHPPASVPEANRYLRSQPKVVTKEDPGAGEVFKVEEGGEGGRAKRSRTSVSSLRRSNREAELKKVALGFRAFGFLFCLISFSVMSADKNQGWAVDSFYRYKEFRYSLSVNVIGFIYSGVEGIDLAYQLATGNYVIRHQLRYYLIFAIDQMLSYLLMSASSSAAIRVDDWESNWGKDKFPAMARASVGLSFMAFVALAFSSLISGYSLYIFRSMHL